MRGGMGASYRQHRIVRFSVTSCVVVVATLLEQAAHRTVCDRDKAQNRVCANSMFLQRLFVIWSASLLGTLAFNRRIGRSAGLTPAPTALLRRW